MKVTLKLLIIIMACAAITCRVGAASVIALNTMESVPYQVENMDGQGCLVEITRKAFNRVGYELDVRFVPWARAMEEAKAGHADGVIGAWYNEERTRFFEYTTVVGKSVLSFIKRKGQPIRYNSLMDLKPYKIGVVRDYTYTDEFDTAAYLQKIESTTTEMNLRKLFYKRIDLMPDVEEVVFYIVKSKYPDKVDAIETLGPPLKVHNIYNTISKKNPDYKKIADDFNRGMQMIKADGSYAAIIKKYGFNW